MTLPLIFPPAGVPPFVVANHSRSPDPVHDDTPMLVGHSRKRRVRTTAPKRTSVTWFLTAVQMQLVDAWFETTLRAGTEKFTAEVGKLGGPRHVEYWAAEWVDPYLAEPIAPDLWRVSGSLLLTGTPSSSRPATGDLDLQIELALEGFGQTSQPVALDLQIQMALGNATSLSLDIELALDVYQAGYFDREDSAYIEREDGARLQRE